MDAETWGKSYDSIESWGKQYDEQQAAQKAAEQAPPLPPHQQLMQLTSNPPPKVTPSFIDHVVSFADSAFSGAERAGRDIGAGLTAGAVNTGDAAVSFGKAAVQNFKQSAGGLRDPSMQPDAAVPTSPVWDHVRSTALDFRDTIAVQHPGTLDNVLESAAQMVPSYIGFGRLLSGIHEIAVGGGLAARAAAFVAHEGATGAASEATANDPHSIRVADAVSMLRQTQGKFGQALRAAAPDGSAFNEFINYLADNRNESEAEGRFKNAIEGAVLNPLVGPLFASVGSVLKQGWRGLRFAVDNGVASAGEFAPSPTAQRGAVGDLRKAERRTATEQVPVDRRVTVRGARAELAPDDEARFQQLMQQPAMREKFRQLLNNASGESAASQEAQNWVQANKRAGVVHYRLDPEGKPTILPGIEARDPRPMAGHPVVQLNAQGEHELIERGGLTKQAAEGLVARSRELHGLGTFAEKH